MPVHIVWDDDDRTIIRYDYEGRWTWEELYIASKQVPDMFSAVSHSVDVIHNLTGSRGLPGGALSHANRLSTQLPDNWGVSVVAGSNMFVSGMLNVFRKIYRQFGERYFTTTTLEEAYALLRERHDEK